MEYIGFAKAELEKICAGFGIEPIEIGDVIDTSHGEEDIRYHYIINRKYVLKINTAPMVTEEFLRDINQLAQRYSDVGVWCPKIRKNMQGTYLYEWTDLSANAGAEKTVCKCYMEEYAPYRTAEDCVTDEFAFRKKAVGHLGQLAAKYTNVELVKHRSMWSVIELAPLDVDVDEKQENADELIQFLQARGYGELATELTRANEEAREAIRRKLARLPRCVYQGDMNFSNLLMDEEENFRGLIDFNLYGTEVNINCFINETAFLQEMDFEEYNAADILERMRKRQEELLAEIFRYYTLNEDEKACFEAYRRIVELFQYPNVMLYEHLIREGKCAAKVAELLRMMAEK